MIVVAVVDSRSVQCYSRVLVNCDFGAECVSAPERVLAPRFPFPAARPPSLHSTEHALVILLSVHKPTGPGSGAQ